MSEVIATEGDEVEAVLRVLEAETRAFFAKDFEAFSRCWLHAPFIRRLGWWTRGGVTDRWGWDDIGDRTRQMMLDHPDPNPTAGSFTRENMVVRVSGDMAWATFDEYGLDTGEPDVDMPGLTREMRVLERHEGEWRIVFHTYIHQTKTPERAPMFRLDRAASISWMNNTAERLLTDASALLVATHGGLHARHHANEQQLRSAIAAAACDDAKLDGSRTAVPVILESEDGEQVCVCWVLAEGGGSGAVLVSVNNLTFSQDQIDAATLLFKYSPSQQRLAESIVAGRDLMRAARELGISINTARTHLQRIYDKTGVRSQPALVRTLLSVSPPAVD